MQISRYWQLMALGGMVVALLLGLTIAAPPAPSTDAHAPGLATVTPADEPIYVVGYWAPSGEVAGVVDVRQRTILRQDDGWLLLHVDGGGQVWVTAAELLQALGETSH